MPITLIQFSTSQESINKIGLKSWRKFGAEYQIDTGENLEDAKKSLKDFVYASLKAQQDTVPEEVIQVKTEPETKSTEEHQIIEGINSATKEWLDKLWKMKANYSPKTLEAYNKKFAELNGTS